MLHSTVVRVDHMCCGMEAALIRDVLILHFHTVQPPDRVGVARKLQIGATLKPTPNGGYTLDLGAGATP